MAEVEIAGAKIKGGRLMLLVPIVSALGGGLWGGFEFYKDYMDMKEIIQEIDVDTITAQNTLTQTKLDEAIDYTRDIKNNLREDIMTVEGHVDKIRNEVQNAIDEMNQLQKDTLASMREVEALNRETEKDVRDTMRETESRIEEAMTKLEERLSMRLQEALDNPLVGN
jgi:chromosome segregation ATPase